MKALETLEDSIRLLDSALQKVKNGELPNPNWVKETDWFIYRANLDLVNVNVEELKEIENLKSEIEDITEERDEYENQADDLAAEKEQLEDDIGKLEDDINELRQQLGED